MLVWLVVGGCYQVHQPRGPEDPEAPRPDARACATRLRDAGIAAVPVDLLLVVDNSGSMREEQQALAREVPRLIEVLTTGDLEGDGDAEFPPVTDLHVGVASTDLGAAGTPGVPSCGHLGDDAVLRSNSHPDADVPGTAGIGEIDAGVGPCRAEEPRFISYSADAAGSSAVADQLACIASLGTDGCGFEQPLEVALKALWPGAATEASQVDFVTHTCQRGGTGQGDRANRGFLRNGDPESPSFIAVLVLSDEDDCSAACTNIFSPDSPEDFSLRCYSHSDELFGLNRYADGFRKLRPGNPHLFFFGAIVGVPPDLVDRDARRSFDVLDPSERNAYYSKVLGDPRMQNRVEPAQAAGLMDQLQPSCESSEGKAYPPRRFVQLARMLGRDSVVQSICQPDFSPAITAILESLADSLTVATCIHAGLADTASLPDGGGGASPPGS